MDREKGPMDQVLVTEPVCKATRMNPSCSLRAAFHGARWLPGFHQDLWKQSTERQSRPWPTQLPDMAVSLRLVYTEVRWSCGKNGQGRPVVDSLGPWEPVKGVLFGSSV